MIRAEKFNTRLKPRLSSERRNQDGQNELIRFSRKTRRIGYADRFSSAPSSAPNTAVGGQVLFSLIMATASLRFFSDLGRGDSNGISDA